MLAEMNCCSCLCKKRNRRQIVFDRQEEFLLFQAVDTNDEATFNKLLSDGVDINAIEHENNHTVLHWACENGNWLMVKNITIHPKFNQANMFMLDKYGDNCLTLSTYFGSMEIVRHLVEEHGMDINNNATGQRPLLWAVECRRPSIFTYFLNKQADINFIVKGTSQPFLLWIIAKLNQRKPKCKDPSEIMIYIQALLMHAISVNVEDEFGNTALCYAVAMQNISLVSLLCEFNADVNCSVNKSTMSLLDYANEMRLTDVYTILRIRGAKDSNCTREGRSSSTTKISIQTIDIFMRYDKRPRLQLWRDINI